MTPLASLWLPIVLTIVFIFIASSLVHTVLPWHKSDWAPFPDEDGVRRALGPMRLPPGDYVIPHCTSMKETATPEFKAKLAEGPVMMATVRPSEGGMAPMFIGWTLAVAAATLIVACVAASTLAPGTETRQVWHLTALVTFGMYAFGSWPQSIWLGRKWSSAVKDTFDALIYAAITACTFGAFWPAG